VTAPVAEFTDLGRCPECNQTRWRQAVCTCGHGVVFHDLGKRKGVTVRTGCSHHECPCALFAEAVA
jgi:hypothetical protein